MDDITCRDCPWHDTRPSTNSALAICPFCGTDGMIYTPHVDAPVADPAPAPAPVVADEPPPPTPPA